MIFTKQTGVADSIITLLSHRSYDTTKLFDEIQKVHGVSKQGFYKALRQLVSNEVVVKNKQEVSLAKVWIETVYQFALRTKNERSDSALGSVLGIRDGQSIVLRSRSLFDLDVLWTHYLTSIIDAQPSEEIIFYNPHKIWSLITFQSNVFMYDWIVNSKRTAYEIIGHNTPLDKDTTRHIRDCKNMHWHYEATPTMGLHIHTTILGDYIFETIIDKQAAKDLNELYKKYQKWSKEVEDQARAIMSTMKPCKVVISKDRLRAQKIRKKLLKAYFIF